MSLRPSLNDPEALDFKRHPGTGTSRGREIKVTGERVVKEAAGHQPWTPGLPHTFRRRKGEQPAESSQG